MPETEVRLSYNSLLHSSRPDIPLLWKNKTYINWAENTGYNGGVEFLPFYGPAKDILKTPIEVISKIPQIRSGHVFYNPYATFWDIVSGKPDPLRTGEKLAKYNLLMIKPTLGRKTLHKLEEAFGNKFPVVTYPYETNHFQPYGIYAKPWLQTHPAVFNDESTENELITLVRLGYYKGIVWDTFHAMEKTKSGNYPLANWEKSLGRLLEAHVVREIHVQAARSTEKYGKVPDREWARAITGSNPKYNNELGRLIKLVKSFGQDIPFVVEISPQGLFDTGILKPQAILHTRGDFGRVHQEIIDYIKRV